MDLQSYQTGRGIQKQNLEMYQACTLDYKSKVQQKH